MLVASLDASKAEDIITVPLAGKSTIADYMIIVSGRSARHVIGLASILGGELHKLGIFPRFEGKGNGDWVLADVGDVIVHIFRPEVRSFYNLEKIWCQPEDAVPEVPAPAARKAVTPRRRKVAAA